MGEGKRALKYSRVKTLAVGVLFGAAAFAAVSAFKDSGALRTAAGCIVSASVCAWSFEKVLSAGDRRRSACCLILAVLFASFSVVGYCFAMDSTPERLYASRGDMFKAVGALAGYSVIFYLVLRAIFLCLKERSLPSGSKAPGQLRGYAGLLVRRPFMTVFLTLLIGYIPYVAVSYPALFMGDCQTIIPQGFGAAPFTTHHPVIYTLFLCGVLKAGTAIFHSWNAAIFVFSVLQLLFYLSVMSYSIQVLIQKAGCSWKWALALEMFFLLSPRISNCMFVTTKDVYYAAFLLLFSVAVFVLLQEGWKKENTLRLAFAAAGILIFRKDGYYVLLLSFASFMLFNQKLRKRMPAFLAAVVLLHLLFNQVIYPAAGIRKGSIKEMLSIPLQQTARCAKYLADSLSEEEKAEILDLFDFDSLEEMGAAYDPSLVDYIKFRFPEQVDDETLSRYLRLWASMGKKYPATYVNAFINNYFEYVYPGCIFMQCSYEWSETCFHRVNEKIGSDFHYPEALGAWRTGLEDLRERIFENWPFRLLNMPGMTTWILMIWAAWLIYSQKYDMMMLTVPLFAVMLICFASPCNGYYCRYQYPLLACIPWGILAGRDQKRS